MVTPSIAVPSGFELVRPRALSRKARQPTQESLDRLLEWLHPDREEAGRAYEQIRRKLIKIFTVRCCSCPEGLADETMDRVIDKVAEIAAGYQGDPSLYFYGVAKNVFREYSRSRKPPAKFPAPDPSDSVRPELECLEACMGRLIPKNRELRVEYYQEEGKAKIENRKAVAGRLGLEMNALRIHVHRIRSIVSECTIDCLKHRASQ